MGRTIIKTALNFKKHSRLIIALAVIVASALIIGCTENKPNSDTQDRISDINDKVKVVNEYYGSMEQYEGMSMRTEFDVYSPETTRILAYWENNTDEEFTFGESWQLFQKQDGEFVPIFNTVSGLNYGFNAIGYGIRPGKTYKHIYWLEPFTDKLTSGIYQIKTHFNTGSGETLKSYVLETEFEVSDEKSKWGISALDFLNGENAGKYTDITGGNVFDNTDFRLYKDRQTYDTILTDGVHEYEIEKGFGQWGVVTNSIYEADEKKYLVYSYSSTIDNKYSSYLCVLDITDNSNVKQIYKSEPFLNDYIISFSINAKHEEREDGTYAVFDENGDFVMDNKFRIFYEKHYEDGKGGGGGELMDYVGWLIYENGGFFYKED